MNQRLPCRCVVVDGHSMVMQMLCGVLRTLPGIEIVGTGTGPDDGPRLSALPRVDLAIIADGLGDDRVDDVVMCLVSAHPAMRFVVLTGGHEPWHCRPSWSENLIAVIRKSEPLRELLAVIADTVGPSGRSAHAMASREDLLAILTSRQCDVVHALGKGLTNKEIAHTLGISVQTVETHRKVISKKLGCNGASLVRLATLSCQLSLEPSSAEPSPNRRTNRPRRPRLLESAHTADWSDSRGSNAGDRDL